MSFDKSDIARHDGAGHDCSFDSPGSEPGSGPGGGSVHPPNWFFTLPTYNRNPTIGIFSNYPIFAARKGYFGFLMYQKSLILGYFPIIKIAAIQMALIRPIRRRNDTVN